MAYLSRLHPSVNSSLRHAYFYAGRTNANPFESGVHPKYAGHLWNAFNKYAPQAILHYLDRPALEYALQFKQKAVLVISGGHAFPLSSELAGLTFSIRKKIESGDWNFLGVGSGAVYASEGLVACPNDPISEEPDFLALGPFRAAGFPYPVSGRQFKGIQSIAQAHIWDGRCGFNAHWNSGPCLELTAPNFWEDFAVVPIAEFRDVQFKKKLGIAAVKGNYGRGKYVACSYHPEVDSSVHKTGMSPVLQKLFFGKSIQDILTL